MAKYCGDTCSEKEIYNNIVNIANKFCYIPEIWGTLPIFICSIINQFFKVKSHVKYFKEIGFNFDLINNNTTMLLSMINDRRNYYKNYTVSVIGYID